MTGALTEADWERHALAWLGEGTWRYAPGASVAPGAASEYEERQSWDDLLLVGRLREAIERINPDLPPEAVEGAVAQVRNRESQEAFAENFRVHTLLTRGVRVTYTDHDGVERSPTVWLLNFDDPYANDFLAVNQVVVKLGQRDRRLDIVAYVNGLPLAVFELKKADDENATSRTAYNQLRTYLHEFGPAIFGAPVMVVTSDGVTARVGTVFTPWEHIAPWDVDEWGNPVSIADGIALEVLISGVFEPTRFLDLIANFVSFSVGRSGAITDKKLAKAHQYFAVNKAVDATLRAVSEDGRIGVVWHTQGSGKSKEMEFYANKVMRHRKLGNPTIVVLTDRLELDDQLYRSFAASKLLPDRPTPVSTRDGLRDELASRASGGVIFATLQKFAKTGAERRSGQDHPTLSTRRNVIVIADEAHRSHYDFIDGFARNLHDALPHASFIAFTGTPISGERDTRRVFGGYIDIYDLTRAIADGATVRVFYDNHHVPVRLPEDLDPDALDERAEEAVAQLEPEQRRTVARAFRMIEEVIGAPNRLQKVAADIVAHWEQRRDAMIPLIGGTGKGMIVCFSRKIAALLYEEIVALRPEWAHDEDNRGKLKVVYTGVPGDEEPISYHVRNERRNDAIRQRMYDPDDQLELVIVASMWLTGFDCPPLHTQYLDKPMQGAALMQAITRVNRTFENKPAGLIVDYIGITERLTEARAQYTPTDQREHPIGADTAEAVNIVREQHGVICEILAGYDWRTELNSGSDTARIDAQTGGLDYLRDPVRTENLRGQGEPDLATRFNRATRVLTHGFALCPSHDEVRPLLDDIGFFNSVRIWMAKLDAEDRAARGLSNPPDVELALRQLASSAVVAGQAVDIFEAAGLPPADLSRLDDALVQRLRESTRPNLAIEALRRMLEKQIRATHRNNLVAQRRFSDRLLEAMRRYTNNALTSAQIIAELVEMSRAVHADKDRARELGLTDDELAFYDAVATNESAVQELGRNILAVIARDLVRAIRADITVDWTIREQVQARLRSKVKRLLALHGYPPDAEQHAVDLVLQQTKTFAQQWAEVV